MTEAQPLLVVSVLNWNTAALTRQCLHAVQQSSGVQARIVVVDNASQDGSVAQLRAAFPAVTLLQAPHNLGFAAGHALALRQAQEWDAAAICLLNSDAQVEPDTLQQLVQAWQRHGDALYGALPLHRDGNKVQINFPQKFLDADAPLHLWRRDRLLHYDAAWQDRPPQRVAALVGSCLLLPLALVRAQGWMDADWFLYCEEIDYCLRLRRNRIECWLVPQARLWHAGGGSQQDQPGVADCVDYYKARNEIELARRHAGRGAARFIAARKLLRALLLFPRGASARRRARLLLRAVRDAQAGRLGKTLAPEQAWQPRGRTC
jgi:N-acetylglucosaminyl-diphospho-decaprenol L-rhamnosyltransferase